jgi:protoheme ferro-lyase
VDKLRITWWIFVAVLGFLGGLLLVLYMTVPPIQMSLYLLLALLSFFCLIFILTRFKRKSLLLAAGISLLSIGIGYYAMTSIVLNREDTREIPQITRQKNNPADGHTAVIYFTHGEPETYDPIGWLNQFREFDKQGIPFIPKAIRPVFIYQLRNAYLEVGQSHHRQMHIQMADALQQSLLQDGYADYRVYLSFLDDEPRPDAAVINAINEGASEIIAAEVFVTISNHTAEGEELIEAVGVEEYGIPLRFTGPLWNSNTLHRMFLDKANAAIGDMEKSKVGVILVGHGQPDEWDVEFSTETEQELLFRERILELFIEDGYEPDNLGLAWMSFKEPKPAELVDKLLGNGVEMILFYSAAISADSIHSQHDIPELVYEADIPEDVPVINLGAWNDHPLTIQAIKELVLTQAE